MKTRRGCLKTIRIALIMTALFVAGLWGLLRLFDPLGAYRYYNDLSRLFAGYVVSDRGYSMYPGLYTFSNWSALIERNGNRHVPDSKDSTCEIAFVGDSVAFGFGVNDTETFVNRIAQQVDVRITNTAIPLYNSENIRRTIETYPADGYVYVIIGNDDEQTQTRANAYPVLPYLIDDVFGMYWDAIKNLHTERQRDRARFDADIAALGERDDVLLIAFRDPSRWYERLPSGVTLLPHWTHGNSYIDSHPNAAGHAEIAAALMPYVRAFEGEVCRTK